MDVAGVVAGSPHEVYPETVDSRLAGEIERAFGAELRRMPSQDLRELRKSRIALRKVVERGIAGVAGVAMLMAPAPARPVLLRKASDRMRKIEEQRVVAKLGLVEPRREE